MLVIAAAHAQPPLHSPACIFNGADLHDKSGATIDGCSVLANHSVALYFAGEWCPLCRRFTPALREFHRQDKDTSSIVFVSSDASREDATTHFANSLHSDGIFQVGWESDLAASLKRKHRVWSGREIGAYGPNRQVSEPRRAERRHHEKKIAIRVVRRRVEARKFRQKSSSITEGARYSY